MFLKRIENMNSNQTTTYLCKQYYKTKLYFWVTMWWYGVVYWEWGLNWNNTLTWTESIEGLGVDHRNLSSAVWGKQTAAPQNVYHSSIIQWISLSLPPTPPPVACSAVNWLLHSHLSATLSFRHLNLPVHIHPHTICTSHTSDTQMMGWTSCSITSVKFNQMQHNNQKHHTDTPHHKILTSCITICIHLLHLSWFLESLKG